MTKLSVITINYNNKCGLLRTLISVKSQKCHNFEYIIIDGGSTDGSIDLIKEYSEYIDYWISEPDNGIYNAMNKGVKLANGEYIQFLNSGDWFYSDSIIGCVLPHLISKYDVLTGYVRFAYNNGKRERARFLSPEKICISSLIINSLSHPSSFVKKSLLLESPFDESYKIVADLNFFINIFLKKKIKYCLLDFDIANFDMTGISSNQYEKAQKECQQIRDGIIHDRILEEIIPIPSDIIISFNQIPNSYFLKKLLSSIVKYIIKIYAFIKPNAVKNIGETKITPDKELITHAELIDFNL